MLTLAIGFHCIRLLPDNVCVNAVGAFDIGFRTRVIAHSRSTPWCAWHADLLVGCRSRTGASPLYENESLKEGSIPAVTPIDQVLDEGNCGEVTNRGKAAANVPLSCQEFSVDSRILIKAARLRTET